ncbi:GC-rich sequence DNA-binding factor [Borealophlyctis nickersoniae]|nr:GC-rich sequence DNA-binding factor [Borealophlyctis nickersoniae]
MSHVAHALLKQSAVHLWTGTASDPDLAHLLRCSAYLTRIERYCLSKPGNQAMSFATFRKPKAKNLRKVIQVEEDEGDAPVQESSQADTPQRTPVGTVRKEKKLAKSATQGGVSLSFAEEQEEADAFQIKKTAASRRMMRAKLNRDVLPDTVSDPLASARGSYSAESLRQLKESQRSRPALQSIEPLPSASTEPFALSDGIPDANAIHAARKLREERRAAGISGEQSSPDFISLSGWAETSKTSRHESRLVTEDQEIEGEEAFEDYEGDHINFGADAVKKEEQRRHQEMQANLIEAEEEDMEDEELNRWEAEQIRKGGVSQPLQPQERKDSKPLATLKVPSSIPVPSIMDASARMASLLRDLELNHDGNVRQLAYIKVEIDKSASSSEGLEVDRKLSSDRYTFFQELKSFVGDVADFMDAKVWFCKVPATCDKQLNYLDSIAKLPEVENLETEYHDILAAESDLVLGRRKTLMDHDFSTFTTFEVQDPTDGEIDAYAQRANAIGLRNQRHHARLAAANGQNDEADLEGLSTDDESEPVVEAGTQERRVAARVKHSRVFEDTVEEFRAIPLVKQRLETWKLKYPKDYENAFGSLSIPGVFELHRHTDLESMHFHQQLAAFGIGDMADMDSEDPDAHLLMKIVEKVCIPRLKSLLDTFDPWSSRQTKRLIRILGEFLNYTSSSSVAFKAWAVVKLLNHHLLGALQYPASVAGDLLKYEKILQAIPSDWIGDGHSTPPFLHVFERHLKDFAVKSGASLAMDRSSADRLIKLFVSIKSFDEAAKLSKRLK